MSITALQAAAQAAARARDPGMAATAKATVYGLLSRLQTIVNGATEAVIQTATLTAYPNTPAYSISGNLPSALRIVDVRDAMGRSLDGPIPFRSLAWLNREWWRETGPELRSWSLVGRDLLILRPNLTVQQTVTVAYAAVTAGLNVDSDLFQCPDEDVALVLDLTELLLDLKARDLADAKPLIERWTRRVQATISEAR